MFFAGTSATGNLQAAGTTAFTSFTTTVTGTENATDSSSAGFSGTYTNTTGAASLRSLRFDTAGAGSLTIGTGSILNITGGAGLPGGILDTTNVGANTTSIAGGALTSSGGELVVFQQNTAGTLSISSRIENSYNFGGTPSAVAVTKAVDDVSFELAPGETLGLVGESGSGKTTTVRCILRAIDPTAGAVRFRRPDGRTVDLATLPARELKPIRRHAQMVFQDPVSSLNPRMTVGEIVGEPLVIHGLARGAELDARVAEILARVGLEADHRRRYPHAFSGGQRQRIGIARALIMRPSLLVCDEATSALDVTAQAQVLELLKELQREFRLTYLFVAHNLEVVRNFCDRVAVMRRGRIVELAPTERIFAAPQHAYTKILLSAVPSPDPDVPMNFNVAEELAKLDAEPQA
jgi:ABC-type oligopeptide transport system ATPase subunit